MSTSLRKNEAEAFEAARRRAVFTAHAAAEAVETTLDRFRVTLTTAATAAAQGPEALRLYGDAVSSGVDELVYQLFRIDADGTLAYTSLGSAPRNYLGDRDYFKRLARDPSLPLMVNQPVLGRLSGKWSLQVARAVVVDGRFAGVVALAVNPDRWTERLGKFEADDTDVLTLLDAEGVYLLRTREPQQSYGHRLPADRPFLRPGAEDSGTYVQTGARDGVLRLYAWQRLSGGLVLASGIGLEAALAPARELNRLTILRGAAATLALVAALAVIAYFSRRSDRVSRAVAEQEYLQRVTLSVMAEGLAVVAPSGEITFHNDSFARIIPYDAERLRRTGGCLGWDVVDAGGEPLPLERFPSVVCARTGLPLDNVTLGLRTDSRAIKWLNINARPLMGAGGRPYAAILTVTDTTSQRLAEWALRDSEERYRTVVESLMEGILVHGPDGVTVACNPAAERIFAVPRAELLGRSAADPSWRAIHPDGSEMRSEDHPVMVTLRTGQRHDGEILGLRRADGGVTWVEVNTAPLWGAEDSMPAGVVASFLDVTHRKEFEDELSRSNAELEQFAYAVSHDLREPLRMVASYIQLLERRLGAAATDEIKEFVGFAVDGAKRMDRMLVALLEYSRVGRMGQPMDWVDSRRVLEEALLFLSPVIQQTGAQVAVTGDWPAIFASPDEIERLFQNLLGNALKYHAENVTPVINISAERDGAAWRFAFRDNGIGIAPDQVGRLFKVFQRLHPNDRYEGSGVGLALCRRIVQRHDGRIWVESDGPGSGSAFLFTLPASHVHPQPIPAEAAAG
ncbi:MAG: ATP-binding protein [Magnetospirillum sp.]|nr:ATP-binding protein [Magnetospirillum sp.]